MEQCVRENLPLPKAIQEAPSLFTGLELYYAAFLDLQNCRTGMGDGPISYTATREYGVVNEFSDEQIEDLHYFIPKLDEEYMRYSKEKNGKS